MKTVSILVATHHRPELLEKVLLHLRLMTIPEGWQIEILVGGTPTDPGKERASANAVYLGVPDDRVTVKLNALLELAKGELIVLADDDDIQPPNRLVAAVAAHEAGADWSGSGSLWFYHVNADRLTFWSGASHLGLVGTSLSFRASVLRQVGGWPVFSKGKDGPLAELLRARDAEYKDITAELSGNLVAIQHGANLWDRPPLDKGQKLQKGNFIIEGFGPLADNATRFHPRITKSLRELKEDGGDSDKRLYVVTGGRPGVAELVQGMTTLGIPSVSLGQARNLVQDGHSILAHWYHEEFRELGVANPGRVLCVWPYSWAETALTHNSKLLAQVIEDHHSGILKLYWLNTLDTPPVGITHLPPVWTPEKLVSSDPGARAPRRAVVGIHANQEGLRNHLAALVGCTGMKADIQCAGEVLDSPLGEVAKVALAGEQVIPNTGLTEKAFRSLLATAEVFVYPPLVGGWSPWLLESVYMGTPVVISPSVPWAMNLPLWARKLCLVSNPESTKEIQSKVRHLLDHPKDREHLVQSQAKTLNKLAKTNARLAKTTLNVPDDLLPVIGAVRRRAAFLVTTNHQPELLHACLKQIRNQVGIPQDWSVEIMVAGQPDDPGYFVAKNAGVKYIGVSSTRPATLLNAMLSLARAELILVASDDTLPPLNQARVSIEAFEGGCSWGGSGAFRMVDLETVRVAVWKGDARRGVVGSSMFYENRLLQAVGGWPEVDRGEAGALASKIHRQGEALSFADLSEALGDNLISVCHPDDPWTRPFPDLWRRKKRGGFLIEGGGPLQLTELPEDTVEALRPHFPELDPPMTDPPRVVLAAIVLNEEEFLSQWIDQHMGWPGLEAMVVVEGSTLIYGERNPDAVSVEGLSMDGTSRLLRLAEAKYPGKFIYVPFGWADGPQAQQKRTLRDAYCEVADTIDPDLLIVLDGDEFYTYRDQERILTLVRETPDYLSWRLAQRHVWRPPSIYDEELFQHEVVGGYWDVPHCRVWNWMKGSRYLDNHNLLSHVDRPFDAADMFEAQRWDGTPECLHLGFARAPEHRMRTNAYYVARGEGQEKGLVKRGKYVDCRSAWETWETGKELPHGSRVIPYQGPIPEVYR